MTIQAAQLMLRLLLFPQLRTPLIFMPTISPTLFTRRTVTKRSCLHRAVRTQALMSAQLTAFVLLKRISARVQISIFFSTSKPRFQELAIPKADIFMLTMFPMMTFSRATIKTTNIIRDFWVCTLIIATFSISRIWKMLK